MPWVLAGSLMAMLLGARSALALSQSHTAPGPVQAAALHASATDIVFEHLSENSGLASTAVSCFAEDGDGFLWVGSQSGLQRWDGYRFWSYKQVLGSATSLPDNLVESLYTDSQGRLWVGTSSGGLAMYDRREDHFVRYRSSPNDLERVNVFAITGDGGRGLWVASNTGLDHLDPDSGKFTHERLAAIDGRRPQYASALVRGADGTLWVGTDLGLERGAVSGAANLGRAKQGPQHEESIDLQAVPLPVSRDGTNEVLVLFRDSKGKIWVGTAHGAYIIDPAATAPSGITGGAAVRPQAVEGKGAGSETLATQRYLSIAEASDGEIWLGTQDEGVLALTPEGERPTAGSGDSWRVRHIMHGTGAPGSLADDMVYALYLGRPGIMWAGTRRGVSLLDTTPKGIFTMQGGTGPGDVIRDADVYSVLARKDGSVWLALSHEGIDVLDGTGQRIAQLQTGTLHPETTLPPVALGSLVEAGDGSVLIGTQRGLYRAALAENGKGGRMIPKVTLLPIGPEASTNISRILPDGGKLWIGGSNGLWLSDPAENHGLAKRAAMQRQLTDQRVTVLMKGGDASLWIGTQNGLNRLDLATQAMETILPDVADPAGLGAGFISSLLIDRNGRLWVGTFSGGIDVLAGHDAQGRARFHRIIDELPNENIDQLLEAPDGRIWASTDDGLAVIDPRSFEVNVLRRADGVMLPAYWNDSGAVTAGGDLLFGGVGGLTVVKPEMVKPWAYLPPVVVTNARIGDVEIPTSRFNSGVQEYPVWIPPDHNNLTVGFTALDYTEPERNRYEYKLEGFDRNWVPADATRRVARYTNLPPGDYVLLLRGSNRDGAWAPERQVRIRVLPAWFQTLWFKIIAVLLVLSLLYLMFLLTTAYLRRQQRELERQVALRTSELELRTVELKDSQQKLEHMAYTDALTGLPNRRMFNEHFKRLLALKRRQENSFSLLLMDLDDFKEINDTYGHDAGDFLLVEMSRRLSELVRESDCLARLGGDEFGLLLGQSHDVEGTELVCRKILENFEEVIIYEGMELRTSPSIGLAIYPFDGETQDKLYKAADLALYHAKRRGGNRCSWSEQVTSQHVEIR